MRPNPKKLRKKLKNKQIRTCLGCGAKKRKQDLLRFTLLESAVKFDSDGLAVGRGAYSCKNTECLGRLEKNRKKLARALRCPFELIAKKRFDFQDVLGTGKLESRKFNLGL